MRQTGDEGERASQAAPATLNQSAGRGVGEQHLFEKRGGLARHVEVGIELTSKPFQGDKGLDQQRQVGRQGEAVFAENGDQVGEHGAEVEVLERDTVILVDKGVKLGLQGLAVGLGAAAPVQQHLGHFLRIVADEAVQQHGHLITAFPGDAPDHAEIDEGDAVIRQVEDVSGMRVGMEETVFEHHLEHGLRAATGQQMAIQTCGFHGGQIAAGNALDIVLHIQPLAGPWPVDAGHHDLGVRGEVGGDTVGAAALGGKIQLATQRKGELAHHLLRPITAQFGRLRLDDLGKTGQQAQVGFDDRPDAGAAHLENDCRAVCQPGAMDLGQRRRRQRPGFHTRENGFGRLAQILRQLRQQFGESDGGRGILQFAELVDPFGREQVDAGGENLPELDEGRSQLLRRPPHPGWRFQPGQLLRRLPVQGAAGTLQGTGHADPPHHVAEAIADKDGGDVMQAAQVADGADCLPEHQCFLSSDVACKRAAMPWSRPAAKPESSAASWRRTSAPFLA